MGGLGTVISNGGAQGQLVRIVSKDTNFPENAGHIVKYTSGSGLPGGLYVLTYDAKKKYELGVAKTTARATIDKDGTTLTPSVIGDYPASTDVTWKLVYSDTAPAEGAAPTYKPNSYFPEGTYHCAIIFPVDNDGSYKVDFLAWADDSPGSGY